MKYLVSVFAIFGAACLVGAESRLEAPAGLIAHEWGTFTSVAGEDGMALTWEPLDGPSDLPCFVHRFKFGAKANFAGKVRMETPVIYLYGPERSTASVRVTFPHGYITEWYPKANRVATFLGSGMAPRGPDVREPRENEPDSIEWRSVTLGKDSNDIDYPLEQPPSHYYAGRYTDSAALTVSGETDKFLFYRGVGSFQPPVAAQVSADDRIVVKNLSTEAIPAAILFENHSGKISYRVHGPIDSEVTLQDSQAAADVNTLRAEVERILVSQGLFPREARAMVKTWGDSWFEEGMRLFYFLPTSAIDPILPMKIQPAPASIARVFVGRMEIFTPAMRRAIKAAITRGDASVFAKYGRFLNPVTAGIEEKDWWSPQVTAMRQKYLAKETSCGKSSW
ncbi:MAG TPA: hypothetical protein VG273_14265 [Bryobacteraceae bacterium]|jgi:hypothetical protein|nr:hypothetical protein [Bryobacteraceae bacterium]